MKNPGEISEMMGAAAAAVAMVREAAGKAGRTPVLPYLNRLTEAICPVSATALLFFVVLSSKVWISMLKAREDGRKKRSLLLLPIALMLLSAQVLRHFLSLSLSLSFSACLLPPSLSLSLSLSYENGIPLRVLREASLGWLRN